MSLEQYKEENATNYDMQSGEQLALFQPQASLFE